MVRGTTQLAPKARQKVARGKRFGAAPGFSPHLIQGRPERAPQGSPNIALVVLNRTQFEHFKIFLLKSLAPMVLLLI